MGRKCRVWWLTHLSSNPPQSAFLFGWFLQPSSNLLDIVVSFASTEPQVSSIPSVLRSKVERQSLNREGSNITFFVVIIALLNQEILHQTNGKMPMVLQDGCMFAMLGYCQADLHSNSKLLRAGVKRENETKFTHHNEYLRRGQKKLKKYESQYRGCHEIDSLLEQNRRASVGKKFLIQLVYESSEYIGRRIWWIPRLHHIHWDSQTVPDLDLYVIIYETPRYGSHHFSLGFYSSSEHVKTTLKKPIWVEDLHAKKTQPDLDTVILAINSAASAKLFFEKLVCPEVSTIWFHIVCMFLTFTWKLLAISVASFSTSFYIILLFFQILLSYASQSCIRIISAKLFSCTIKNIRFRCCQILYWPIFLQNNGLRWQESLTRTL